MQQLGFPWAPPAQDAPQSPQDEPQGVCVGCGQPGQPAPLQHLLHALRGKIAAAAQRHYDEWTQDEEGLDEELGEGGICDRVSDGITSVLHDHLSNICTTEGGAAGDDHAFPVVYDQHHAFAVDIPPHVYEHGGGYKWTKIPDVRIDPEDVAIEPLERGWFDDDADGPAAGHVCAGCRGK